ncbi:MAG: hypothetical protein FJX77_12735 [Armatimonadetes bacterium]|nr:hypothetical protein [Armatimonadota bacterium]
MARKRSVNITVLVDVAHQHSLAGVANDLKDRGFVLREALGAVGVLTGSVPVTALAGLSTVPGVSAVEEEQTDYRTQQE